MCRQQERETFAEAGGDFMPEPIVTFDQVTYRYPGTDFNALNNVSLQIMKGEYVGVIGLNGAGKTTLFRMMLDFISCRSIV